MGWARIKTPELGIPAILLDTITGLQIWETGYIVVKNKYVHIFDSCCGLTTATWVDLLISTLVHAISSHNFSINSCWQNLRTWNIIKMVNKCLVSGFTGLQNKSIFCWVGHLAESRESSYQLTLCCKWRSEQQKCCPCTFFHTSSVSNFRYTERKHDSFPVGISLFTM